MVLDSKIEGTKAKEYDVKSSGRSKSCDNSNIYSTETINGRRRLSEKRSKSSDSSFRNVDSAQRQSLQKFIELLEISLAEDEFLHISADSQTATISKIGEDGIKKVYIWQKNKKLSGVGYWI
jgi:hypothetical protein